MSTPIPVVGAPFIAQQTSSSTVWRQNADVSIMSLDTLSKHFHATFDGTGIVSANDGVPTNDPALVSASLYVEVDVSENPLLASPQVPAVLYGADWDYGIPQASGPNGPNYQFRLVAGPGGVRFWTVGPFEFDGFTYLVPSIAEAAGMTMAGGVRMWRQWVMSKPPPTVAPTLTPVSGNAPLQVAVGGTFRVPGP